MKLASPSRLDETPPIEVEADRGPALAAPVRRRTPLYLLGAWIVLAGAWLLANFSDMTAACPYGQGCVGPVKHYESFGDAVPSIVVALTGVVVLAGLWWWERLRSTAGPTTLPQPGQRRWRPVPLAVATLVGTLIAGHLLMFAPMRDDAFCAEAIHLNSAMSYVFNCDSYEFLMLAHHPKALLKPNSVRQSRPVYVVLSVVLDQTAGRAASLLHINQLYQEPDRSWASLVGVNFLVLISAVVLLLWVLHRLGAPPWAGPVLAVLLVVNDVTKAFLWTPHQQMFTLLIPMATVVLGRWALLRRPGCKALAVAGLATGLAGLVYGSVIITLGVMLVILLARRWPGVGLAAVFTAAFAIPQLAWVMFCEIVVGSYSNHELVMFHQFVWLPEAMGQGFGTTWDWVSTLGAGTIRAFFSIEAIPLILLGVLAVLAIVARIRLAPANSEQQAILLAAAGTLLFAVLFDFGVGIVVDRLMYHATPAILVGVGWLLTRLPLKVPAKWLTAVVLVAAAGANVYIELTKMGPYA